MSRIILSICFSAYLSLGIAQDDTLPSLDDLEKSLTEYTLKELNAKLKAFELKKSADWKELLPNLGIAYTPSGSPRPSASWSPLQFLDRKDSKNKRKAMITSIHLNYELILQDRLYKLRQLYQDYFIDIEIMSLDAQSLEIEEILFAIEEEKYKEHHIKPSEFLKAKKKIFEIRAENQLAEMELEKRKHALLFVAKWDNDTFKQLYN